MTNSDPAGIAFFGPYTLNFQERSLSKREEIVPLGARALDILINLVVRAGEVVNRHDLIDLVWRDVVVEEANLRAQLTTLRRALSDGEDGNRYILNIPGQGYSFVCPVSRSQSPPPKPSVQNRLPSIQRLPAPIDNVIGRECTILKLVEMLQSNRFVSVVGAGGLGKTTVALAVADRLQRTNADEQVFFVDLGSVSHEDDALIAIASVLGCPIKGEFSDAAILSFLAGKEALIVLDSCEHVIEAAARISGSIFVEAPGVRLLATTREPLRSQGEVVHILSPLDVPPNEPISATEAMKFSAVQLFMERAEASGHEGELRDGDVPHVTAICRHLDGLALAIELAASRVGAFGIQGTAELLSDGGELQFRGRRSALPRHQTLHAMLDWSVNLLSTREQLLLMKLSVFAGPFTLEAASNVIGDAADTLGSVGFLINSMVEKSLIFVVPAKGLVYYRLLDTTRAYATSKLSQQGLAQDISRRHAAYFGELLKAASENNLMADARAATLFLPHLANVRKALVWCFSDEAENDTGAVELVADAAPVLMQLSHFGECQRWCGRALSILPVGMAGTFLQLRLLEAQARSALYSFGNRDETKALIDSALSLAEQLGDARRQLNLLTELNFFYARRANIQDSLAVARRIADIAKRVGAVHEQVAAEFMLAIGCHHAGDQAAALQHCQTGFSIAEDAAPIHLDLMSEARGSFMLARSLWLAGYPDKALRLARERVAMMNQYTHHISYCVGLTYAIPVFSWCGCFEEAEECIANLMAHAHKNSLADFGLLGRAFKGQLLVETGNYSDGVALLRGSLDALRAQEYYIITSMISCFLAKGLSNLGEHRGAEEIIVDAIRNAYALGERMTLPDLLRTHGQILLNGPEPDSERAEAQFFASMTEAREQSAIGWEMKAGLPLARLWQASGRKDEAHTLLSSIYDKFDQGFDTPDLVAASEMLSKVERVQP